jgi:hypothetical protein
MRSIIPAEPGIQVWGLNQLGEGPIHLGTVVAWDIRLPRKKRTGSVWPITQSGTTRVFFGITVEQNGMFHASTRERQQSFSTIGQAAAWLRAEFDREMG